MRWFISLLMVCFPLLVVGQVSVSVDLGAVDDEDGLVNTQIQDPSDGEVEVVDCGPAADVRDCKKNWASEDPTLDVPPGTWPDGFFYFNVTDETVKNEQRLIVEVTVYDDPALQANTALSLFYTNNLSTGPGDIPNTFSGHPISHVLTGTDAWVTFAWEVNDAGFQTFMQETSDIRVNVSNDQRVCMDSASVTVNATVLPADLTCTVSTRDTVDLSWTNLGAYETLAVERDGELVASLAVDDTVYTDTGVPEGQHTYQIVATAGGESGGPECTVTIMPDLNGQSVAVDLAEDDVEQGMRNSHTAPPDGGDGENEPAFCGPPDEEREGRRNWGAEDPTPDGPGGGQQYPDSLFYFEVTDPQFKGQIEFTLAVTVYDDPLLPPGTGLFMQYTNQQSTGPADIPNTFFPLEEPPFRSLGRTDTWVTLMWPIDTAGFRSFQQGDSDLRIGVNSMDRVCIDKVTLTVGIENLPYDVACSVEGEDVTVTWKAARAYEVVSILREGEVIASLQANETSYVDPGVAPGTYTYEVIATYGDEEGGGSCEATVGTAEARFVRGDLNDDGTVNIADPIALLGYLFGTDEVPACQDAADGNDDGDINIADAIAILGHLFGGTGELPAPFPDCGADGAADALPPCVFSNCP